MSKVNFLCLPFSPCERVDAAAGDDGRRGASESKGKPDCGSRQTAEWKKWKEVCTEENQPSQNPVSDSWAGGDSDKNWFMCETDLDLADLQQNHSSSGTTVKPCTLSHTSTLADLINGTCRTNKPNISEYSLVLDLNTNTQKVTLMFSCNCY